MSRVSVTLQVNGETFDLMIEPRRLLSDVLREECGLTGTHTGCEHGICGACTILIDGRPARACLTFAVQMVGHAIFTIEGVANGPVLSPFQQALHEEHGLQCGFCTPGIVMTIEAWLKHNPNPDDDAIRDVLAGHLCRCTGYQPIIAAVKRAAALLREGAGA